MSLCATKRTERNICMQWCIWFKLCVVCSNVADFKASAAALTGYVPSTNLDETLVLHNNDESVRNARQVLSNVAGEVDSGEIF